MMKTTLVFALFLFTFSLFTFLPQAAAVDTSEWKLPEGAKARLGKGLITEIKYSLDGTKLAVASSIGIWIYDAQTGQELDLYTGHTGPVNSVSFSPDGNTLATGSRQEIRLWNAHIGTHIRTLTGHTDWVNSVSFSPDGNTLATGSDDRTIRLWNAHTGTHIRTLTGHTDWVFSVSFSPDGNTLATGSRDDDIRLWNAHTGQHIKTLTGHTDDVNSVAFSPDGNTLATGSREGTVLLWDVSLLNKPIDENLAVDPTGKHYTKWGMMKSTKVLQNYPNPFNPETWIPYQLAAPANVTLTIYAADGGKVVCSLTLGHQPIGIYQEKSRAAHWDGKNALGESVASGVYFYTLTAGDFTATRKMLIYK